MTSPKKLSVWAPSFPGHAPTVQADCDTMAEARQAAARVSHRRPDLKVQDVFIRLGRDGKIIERCGPC